jgi:uncharacterized membrane protein
MRRRIAAIDLARGAALAGMIVYHFAWDLRFYGLAAIEVAEDLGWRLFARLIAGSFLALVGMSLVLAHGDRLRPRPFLRRLGQIVAAAAAVTIATYLLTPDAFVFFGILHAIALTSVLALPFLRAPLWLIALAAAAVFLAPSLLASPAFDRPWLLWTGLVTVPPRANDYVPLFPWFGMVLVGVLLARLAPRTRFWPALTGWAPRGRLARWLAWAGRHTLAIYLLHQPVLLGALYPVAAMLGPSPAVQEFGFLRSCERSCAASGSTIAFCRASCACLMERSKEADLLDDALTGALDGAPLTRFEELAIQCSRSAP